MKKDFIFAKKVIDYLERRYGKVHKENIAYQIQFRKLVCKDHDLDQLNLMLNRLESSIEMEKIPKLTNNLVIVCITAFVSFIPTFFLSYFNAQSIYLTSELKNELYNFLRINFVGLLVAFFGIICVAHIIAINRLKRLFVFKDLIKECVEIKEKEKYFED